MLQHYAEQFLLRGVPHKEYRQTFHLGILEQSRLPLNVVKVLTHHVASGVDRINLDWFSVDLFDYEIAVRVITQQDVWTGEDIEQRCRH